MGPTIVRNSLILCYIELSKRISRVPLLLKIETNSKVCPCKIYRIYMLYLLHHGGQYNCHEYYLENIPFNCREYYLENIPYSTLADNDECYYGGGRAVVCYKYSYLFTYLHSSNGTGDLLTRPARKFIFNSIFCRHNKMRKMQTQKINKRFTKDTHDKPNDSSFPNRWLFSFLS